MTDTHGEGAERAGPVTSGTVEEAGHGATGPERRTDFDWEAAERSPEFQDLVRKRRSFVVPATIFFLAWYFGFIVLTAYAPDFMGEEFLTDGLTVGYVLALTQFILVWGLGWLYLRRSDRVFDPLARRAAEYAMRAGQAQAGAPAGRYEGEPASAEQPAGGSGEVRRP